jgi:hypothetical protein
VPLKNALVHPTVALIVIHKKRAEIGEIGAEVVNCPVELECPYGRGSWNYTTQLFSAKFVTMSHVDAFDRARSTATPIFITISQTPWAWKPELDTEMFRWERQDSSSCQAIGFS